MADVTTRTLSNYLASLQATPSEDVTLVTQGLETWSTANLVTPGDLGTAAYQSVSYFALAASGVLANSAVQSVTGSGAVSVNNADPRNPIISIVGGGTGDVLGPASATSGRFASFNGTTGKLLQDSGFSSASFATAAQGTLAGTAVQPGALAPVATSGAYGDLSGKPTLGSLAAKNTVTAAVDFSATGTPSATTYLRGDNTWATPAGGGGGGGQVNSVVAGTGISVNATDPVNPTVSIAGGYLATVATTGAYADLTGKPTLGTAAATASTDYATAAQGAKAETALQSAAIGVSVQAYFATLQSWGGITRASGFDTFVATPTSANLAALVTNETGTGSLVFNTSPTLVTPVLGTPTSGTLTNVTGLPLGTGTTGTLAVTRGGTGLATLTANALLVGAGTSNPTSLAPGTSGNVPTSNGTAWVSQAPSGSLTNSVITTAQTLAVNTRYFCNTAGGAFTVTLPASPTDGIRLFVVTDSTAETNALTINTNGATLDGSTANVVVAVPVGLELVYQSSAWRVI